ncbi:MAG: hypothetical protein A2486_02670 [Burkholderiales bacterium RIFOXYC12_FULL_65_23]|nr:MAG: hypothetical protein A2486_02670 [Burkholderiales bacterium RIFOXYC12_FULL_65_23]
MNRTPFRLQAVTALPNQSLHLVFEDGFEADVGLGDWIEHTLGLQALADPALFSRARVGEWGWSVEWIRDELELGTDNLRNLAIEQAGGIGHERLWVWMHECALTQQQAAEAMGISRRMLNRYLSGHKPVPKTVWLACKGWESESVRLPEDLSTRLQHLAEATGRSKTFYMIEAIRDRLDDLEDLYLSEQRLLDARAGQSEAVPLEPLLRRYGV